ncbi:MAG: helix-turn-helix domain-containing protein [Candidatus Absconditabacteria bacterium]
MAKMYNITREAAAQSLGISTRTIDRYIRNGKLSYKKVANKVLLEKDEVKALQQDFAALHQEFDTEVISSSSLETRSTAPLHSTNPQLEAIIDQKIEKFFLVFKEKDKMMEEKNKIIFVLQQRIGELESELKHMIALPDYTKEKQEAILEKQKLEEKIDQLKHSIKNEKSKNLVFIGLSFIFLVVALFIFLKK